MTDQQPPRAGIGTFKCDICKTEPISFRWTDTHGFGACIRCGCPYKLYHYEGPEGQQHRVEKSPELLLLPEWVPITRRYWEETHRNCDPGAYNFPGSSYEVASREDFESYGSWMQVHKNELPGVVEEGL